MWASTILVVSVLLLALGYWTYRAVEGSLRELRAESMKTLLDSQVNALRVLGPQAARFGQSGETFAFDALGTILTGERSGEVTPLRASVDDGAVLEPYVNHRGATVIGAARWLPEYGMGVGIEMDAAEAYAPLRYLQIAFGAVFAALAIAVFAALWSARSVITL
ncbi:MAG TPA: hypothetical protein VET51_06910, partial [Burkholderiales bacterium]|nr:hypothetical protein [Burkholderiales bacterium]